MILVVGSTGLVGIDICRRLAARGVPVRALVRASADPSKVRALADAGVETVVGDLRDRASLGAACAGISGVNDIATTDVAGLESLLQAAATAGVTHVVYTSLSGGVDVDFPLRNAKRRIEGRVRASGMTWTILRPSFFMEAWLGPAVGFDAANARAVIYGDGGRPISWISAGDVAELAARCLRNQAARNATIEMGGPEPLTPLEAVRVFEEVERRPFTVSHVPVEALVAQQGAATDDMGRSFAGLMRCYARGDPIAMDRTARTFGVDLTSVRTFAEATFARARAPVA